jgi:hypothetical protein
VRPSPPGGAVALLLLPLLLACGSSPDQVLREAVEKAGSWMSGADATAELWIGRRVPSAFALVALQDAERGLEAERTRLGRKPDVLADSRVAAALRALDAASVATSRMRSALARADGGEVAQRRGELRRAANELQAAGGR